MIFPTLLALFSALTLNASAQNFNGDFDIINDNTCIVLTWDTGDNSHSSPSIYDRLFDISYVDGNITYTGTFFAFGYNSNELMVLSNFHNCNVFFQLSYRNEDTDNLVHYLPFNYSYFTADRLDETYTNSNLSPNDSIYYECRFYLLNASTYDNIVVADGTTAYENSGEGQYNAGYEIGFDSGYNTGKTDGYTDGYNAGKTDGYTQGYNTALNTHDFSFTNLFASISDTPILMIRRMFSFGIFGVSAISILLSLFTCLIFIKIIKKMW